MKGFEYPVKTFENGRAATIYDLTFGRARIGIGSHEDFRYGFDDVW